MVDFGFGEFCGLIFVLNFVLKETLHVIFVDVNVFNEFLIEGLFEDVSEGEGGLFGQVRVGLLLVEDLLEGRECCHGTFQ